jgi:hypothetical protein
MGLSTYVPQQALERSATLAWTARLKAITPEALAVRNGLSIAEAREHLNEAVRLELMEEKRLLVDYSPLYIVTNYGRRTARKYAAAGGYAYPLGLKKCRATIGASRHMIACASAVATLERHYSQHRVVGETELRREEFAKECPLITMDIPSPRGAVSHSPDIVLWPPVHPGEALQLPVVVEVELTVKGKDELRSICRAFASCINIEAALYFAANYKVENQLLEVIEELKAEDRIVVNPLSELVGSLPGFDFTQR